MEKWDKVENSSEYWSDFESELSVYYHMKWIGEESIKKFTLCEVDFIKKYVSLAYKYGMVIPMNYEEQNLLIKYEDYKLKNEAKGIKGSNLMYYLYNFNLDTNLIYPSKLFTNINDNLPQIIVEIDPIIEYKNIDSIRVNHGNAPLRVELIKEDQRIEILFHLDNDIFNLGLENKKCSLFEHPVDNSDLAYLNTPRLNSFLRDLKKLCFEYGASDFEFEDLGLYDFCEDGVKFGEEVVYYEDIVEMLKPHQRIVQ